MTIDSTTPPAPPRGTRPRNRRALIVAAAAELFHGNGYDKVAMSDVADAVNVRPSALYRHFDGKPQLLTAALLAEIDPFRQVLADAGTLDAIVPGLADVALDHRRLGVLWQREGRSLPPEERTVLRERLRAVAGLLAKALLSERPGLGADDAELLSWCAWAVLHSVGHHSVVLQKSEYAPLLEEIVRGILAFTPSPAQAVDRAAGPGLAVQARREKLLAAALPLFAAQGYAGVSMEDIGARAGIAGPSVYHYFDSKQEILYAALVRGDEWLRQDMHRALRVAVDAQDALRGLLSSYVNFAAENSSIIDVLIGEVRHLPDDQHARITQTQLDYLGEWLHLVRQVRPDMTAMQARARIHAALTVINDIARAPRLRQRANALATVKELALLSLLDER